MLRPRSPNPAAAANDDAGFVARGSDVSLRGVDRAADVLQCFLQAESLSFSAICATTGLSKSVAHRFLAALEARGMLYRDPWDLQYRLGSMMRRLGAGAMSPSRLERVGDARMAALRDRCGETVAMTIRVGDSRVAIVQHESRQQLHRRVQLGQPFPLHFGAGKVLLAHASDRARVLDRMETAGQISDRAALERELDLVRERGYSTSQNEYLIGVFSVAAPVWDGSGGVGGALGITGPIERLDADGLIRHTDAAIQEAALLSAELRGDAGRDAERRKA